MFRSLSRKRRFGFTLVEVLVTTVVIGVLAAVVLPALAKQTSAADPARISSDLNNIKMGLEVFSQNVRPDFPGDLEDLVNAPGSNDRAIDGNAYANAGKWNGPYVAQTLGVSTTATGNSPWTAGGAGFYDYDLKICDLASSTVCFETTVGDGAFVTLRINGLTQSEAEDTDQMLEGSISSSVGMFRYETSGTPAYYYAIPYVP